MIYPENAIDRRAFLRTMYDTVPQAHCAIDSLVCATVSRCTKGARLSRAIIEKIYDCTREFYVVGEIFLMPFDDWRRADPDKILRMYFPGKKDAKYYYEASEIPLVYIPRSPNEYFYRGHTAINLNSDNTYSHCAVDTDTRIEHCMNVLYCAPLEDMPLYINEGDPVREIVEFRLRCAA